MTTESTSQEQRSDAVHGIPAEVRRQILLAVADIRYGSVEVVIQDGKVVQIESREKQRIRAGAPALS